MTTIILALLSLLPAFFQDLPHAFPREGAKQVIDNARVTVWDVTWPKDQPTAMHRHRYDMAGIELADAGVKLVSQDGSARTVSLKTGQAYMQPKGITHMEEGIGGRHAILIDLKETVVPPIENKSGYPLAFPREGAKKLVDNERVVIWDYTWTPGKPSPMHFHDKDVVVVFMEKGELKSTTPDGQVQLNAISFGDPRFNARNRAHTEELVKGNARAIIVELK